MNPLFKKYIALYKTFLKNSTHYLSNKFPGQIANPLVKIRPQILIYSHKCLQDNAYEFKRREHLRLILDDILTLELQTRKIIIKFQSFVNYVIKNDIFSDELTQLLVAYFAVSTKSKTYFKNTFVEIQKHLKNVKKFQDAFKSHLNQTY